MNSGADVSVVVPVYNAEDTISDCIESILRQTFRSLQLIVVDDGSNDGSGAVCDEWARRDSRVVVVHQENRGRSEARWQGVERAEGEWVAFVDSDDTLPPDSIALLHGHAAATTDIVLGNGHLLPRERRPIVPLDDFRHLAVRAEGTIGVPWGSLYRRTLLQSSLFDLPRDMVMGEDYIFWLRLVFLTRRPVHVVYKNVYCKGADHTSNCFVWTAEYAQRIQDYRRQAIPADKIGDYEADMFGDRVGNLYGVAVCSSRKEWAGSRFYRDIIADAGRLGTPLTLRQRIFLMLPSRRLRRLFSQSGAWLGTILHLR